MELYEKFKKYRVRIRAYKTLPQYRKYWIFNILMRSFFVLFILSLLGFILIKLINAQINGSGIQPQFWLGPHGEVVALDDSNCLCNASYYWDFIANIFLIVVIPILLFFFLVFFGFYYWVKKQLNDTLASSGDDPLFWANKKTVVPEPKGFSKDKFK